MIEYVLATLNSFHKNISFTYEKEHNGNIFFLYTLIIGTNILLSLAKNNHTKRFTLPRKSAHNNVYLHWESFVPRGVENRSL